METNYYSRQFSRQQLLAIAVVFLGASLLLMGLYPPQEAHSQENKNETTQSKGKEGTAQSEEKAAQDGQEKNTQGQKEKEEENTATAQTNEEGQEELVQDKDPEGHEYVAGELLVTYKKGAFEKTKDEAQKKVGGKVEKDFPEIEVQHVSVPEVKNEKAQEARQKALERKKEDLEQHPDVEAVNYNYVSQGGMVPSDPKYTDQWGYPKINAPAAWDTTQGSRHVKVAILDSGIDMSHPDLTGKVVGQRDFVNNDDAATDDRGHGTHMAGIVAANTNNMAANGKYVGVAGTCPNCSLLNAKVLDANNQGTYARYIDAILWAVAQDAKVINMSFWEDKGTADLESAVNYAWNRGAVLVAISANHGKTDGSKYYPAAYENVIAVAATDRNDQRASFSNAGEWVDVAAPGTDILSTTPMIAPSTCTGCMNTYNSWSGTSTAAPHVSGLAGLIFSKGSVSNAQVRHRIESKAKDLGTPGKDNMFGHGRIDAQAALNFHSVTRQEDSSQITYSGSDWTRYSWSTASWGYTNWASRSGATAKHSFQGDSVTWWANKGPYGGLAYVWVDGRRVADMDLYSPTNQPSQPVWNWWWGPQDGLQHSIEIMVAATPGRPWVDVDAFTITQPWFCNSYPEGC